MTLPVDLLEQCWTKERFGECVFTVQSDGSKAPVAIFYALRARLVVPNSNSQAGIGQKVSLVYAGVSKWSGAVLESVWPSQASLKSVIRAINAFAYAEVGSVSLLLQQLGQESDIGKKRASLAEKISKLKRLQSNVMAHEEYVKSYNKEHFIYPDGSFACPLHQDVLRAIRMHVDILEIQLPKN